ncbi:MAG TPA: peptidoglycan-binding protein [Candidatus Limiplasma sp.]|nr:peptidoglycan-binding protein [Candidatus Limiplasma sp.]
MKNRLMRALALLMTLALVLSACVTAMATTYPYDTKSGESVKLRKSANTTSVVLANINAGDTVTVLGKTDQFYKITFNGKPGYAMVKYIDGAAEVTPAVTPEPLTGIDKYPYDTTTTTRVKLRKSADANATVLVVIPENEMITVYEVKSNGFAKVKYEGKTGFVMTDFIVLANIPTPTPAPTVTANADATKYTALATGSTGSQVRALQEALTELGYYTGTVDSKYGKGTATAVTAFQKKNGLTQDGKASQELQLFLYEGKPKNPKGYRKVIKTVPMVSGITIQSGNTGEAVENMQKRLQELGYYTADINGNCDKATVTAIKAFQKKMNLTADGIANSNVLDVLYGALAVPVSAVVTPTPTPTVAPPTTTVKKGDKSDDVKKVQQRLADLGYFSGSISGKFDDATETALKAFQKKNKLSQDGVCGAQTRTVLFGINPIYAVATSTPAADATSTPVVITHDTTVTIQSGSRGAAVLALQKRLVELKYYSSRLDGVYLEDDIQAVRSFQKNNNLTVDGKAGYQTQSVLYSATAVTGDVGTTTLSATVRYGDTGTNVTTLQNRLIELGYLTGTADGKFGVATRTALVAFQKANNLVRDGVAGTTTQNTLFANTAVKNTVSTTNTLKQGTISDDVKDMQARLITLGFLTGTADGNFGAKTALALIAFQNANGLTADGIAGTKTLQKLNSLSAISANGTTTGVSNSTSPTLNGTPDAASVRYANWYTEVKARCKLYPYATVYDFTTGLSWKVHIFSLGAHADAEPLTAEDTANMEKAFGGINTWNPKAVWVVFSDGRIYMASTHDMPHEVQHITNNNFPGHLCIHFPRTAAQVAAIGPYATSHQKAIDLGWAATLAMASK